LRSKKIEPFVMPYNKKDMYQKRFARWCNHKAIFKTVKWVDYLRGKDADQYCGVFQSRRTKSGLKNK